MPSFDIEMLVGDLKPVRRLSPRQGIVAVAAATFAAVLVVTLTAGLRSDIVAMRPSEIVVLRSGALLILGMAALLAVLAGARPTIGKAPDGWRWALAAAALFPLTSAIMVLRGDAFPTNVLTAGTVVYCLVVSLASAGAIGAVLVAWLRRGAVTRLGRAGWLTGLAAGSFGTFAYSLHCPSESIHYIATWYSLAIGASACLWRLAVPRLIRW